MKDIIKFILKISLFLLIVYSFVLSFFVLKEEELGLVRDVSTGQIITSFKNKYNFIWQGGMPWLYTVEKIELKKSSVITVIIHIPSLSSLSDDIYAIRLPLNISYQIKKDNLPDISFLTEKGNMDQYISSVAGSVCTSKLIDYIEPRYNRAGLIQNQKRLNSDIAAEISRKLISLGIVTEKIEFFLPGYYPDLKLYEEALVRNREMIELDFNNRKQEILLKKQLLKERSEYELYLEKLTKVSVLIKDNPQILKYIYIDKMGDNIKVIISSDKTGIPMVFGDSNDVNNSGVKGDIDNLR